MTQFPKSTRPLRPASYRAAARRFRQLCDMIDAHADAKHSFQRSILTRAIHDLSAAAQGLSRRHRGVSVAQAHVADAYDAAQAEAVTQEDYDGDHPE